MNSSRFRLTANGVRAAAVAIRINRFPYCNTHAGILYRDGNGQLHVVHLKWHEKLVNEQPSNDFAAAHPELDPAEEPYLASYFGLITHHCPPLVRLGYSGKVIQSVKDHKAGYRLLANYLPGVRLDLKSSDFLYRINRRRSTKTGIAQLKINRVCTWSVFRLNLRMQAVVPSGPAAALEKETYACTCNRS